MRTEIPVFGYFIGFRGLGAPVCKGHQVLGKNFARDIVSNTSSVMIKQNHVHGGSIENATN